jgi:hypothetical protein
VSTQSRARALVGCPVSNFFEAQRVSATISHNPPQTDLSTEDGQSKRLLGVTDRLWSVRELIEEALKRWARGKSDGLRLAALVAWRNDHHSVRLQCAPNAEHRSQAELAF